MITVGGAGRRREDWEAEQADTLFFAGFVYFTCHINKYIIRMVCNKISIRIVSTF